MEIAPVVAQLFIGVVVGIVLGICAGMTLASMLMPGGNSDEAENPSKSSD